MPRRTDEQGQTSRAHVSGLHFAPPPPSARRPSWISPIPGSSVMTTPDSAGRRPSWTPAPAVEGSGTNSDLHSSVIFKAKKRLYYPAHVEESGSGSGSGSTSDSSASAVPSPDGEGESSEDSASNFRMGLQIDMKGLVGDAVGNMSISPTSRDIVLAARRGLFIIDLESPLSVPRFLPQGGSWDVADVQWNPHVSRAEYIVSTSSEKLLIWNLLLTAGSSSSSAPEQNPSSIQHVLQGHYRAITDINWHPAPAERDLVVSTGVDSWVWAWDLRAAKGGRAVFGLSAFNAGGTQVKWNRQDPHILASSHGGEVLIWDRRKGSLPITRLHAHRSKIYGIDWSPTHRDGLVTCALDGTIKVWDTGASRENRPGLDVSSLTGQAGVWDSCIDCGPTPEDNHAQTPVRTIRTAHPVWRARHLPFGHGVLSLPQRGGTSLGMYALGSAHAAGEEERLSECHTGEGQPGSARPRAGSWGGDEPVEVFEGHTDVVKEFVWRKGSGGTAFQLITWSKDRTLRFWPVDEETMQKFGYMRPEGPLPGSTPTQAPREPLAGSTPILDRDDKSTPTFSFRNPPLPEPLDNGVLSENALGLMSPPLPTLSAPVGGRTILAGVRAGAPVVIAAAGQSARASAADVKREVRPPGLLFSATAGSRRMTRGTAGGRRMGVDALTWLSNVKEVVGGGGAERSSSGGRGGGAGSSGGVSEFERADSLAPSARRRSDSRGARTEEGQSLQDELTSVISKLVSAKIKLEKHDLTKKRTCTLGLHGPWGESSSVFIRITFTFPKDYPHRIHPRGTPTVELERNPLISLKNRAFILRRLRTLRERQRPCLEACLRFLSEGETSGLHSMDSESSDSDEQRTGRKARNGMVSLIRSHKNLTEPRTSQGTFGPNGELVCFFPTPPRIVRHVLRGPKVLSSPAKTVSDIPPSHDSVDLGPERPPLRRFRSPALIADAVRRLSLSATDRVVKPLDPRHPQAGGDHILRIMTNLLTFSHDTPHHRESETSRSRLTHSAPRRSTVFITNTSHISGGDYKVAAGYVFEAETLALLCQKNAEVARDHGRYDHERIFKILQVLFPTSVDHSGTTAPNALVVRMVTRIHSELCKLKDLQMLAMLSTIVLQGCRRARSRSTKSLDIREATTPRNAADYFSISRASSGANSLSPISPTWPRFVSPPLASNQPALSTSGSSRGSWSSLFNAGSVRQFMSGVQDSFKEGLMTPSELPVSSSGGTIPVPKAGRIHRGPDSPLPPRRGHWRDAGLPSPSTVSKSWNEATSPNLRLAVSFSSAGHRRTPISQFALPKHAIQEARVVVYDVPVGDDENSTVFPDDNIAEFVNHVHLYAEVLFSWQLYHKRLELLKSISHLDAAEDTQHSTGIHKSSGMMRRCLGCGDIMEQDKNACRNCSRPCGMPHCTVCRLPVKGLSRSCLRCFHVTHISCWGRLDSPLCPSGCGCLCDLSQGPHHVTRP
ncbi:hypothetical protein GGX14DRAFT_551619 [Mycena pura]|uniref:WDR59/RTC1-like RING zinc finger domain-containing protein n=1 Tax=Mycena pura TaxID=153505 RepID=A0AAD6VES8_9AGAR|nr:hypothetical protein GGX14DRAFT_551619 [Mycena pura]